MQTDINEITINGKTYIEKGSESAKLATPKNNLPYKIIRAQAAGVFAGYVESVIDTASGRVVVIKDVRRLWYWSGAASLSQLAIDGTCKPNDCKFPAAVSKIEVSNVLEILDCTEKCKKSLEGVKVWEQK